MKMILQRSFSFIMAVLVLFSTMSFTVEKHFCGKSLVGHSVFSSVKKCKSETSSCGVEGMMSHMKMAKDSCCTDETERILGQDELNLNAVSFDLVPQTFTIPMTFVFDDLLSEISPEVISYPPYEPPQLVSDIQIMCQVFII